MARALRLAFLLWFFLPAPAHAYLDPGTGNVLVYVAVSFFGAALFFLKGLFYRIVGKRDALESERYGKEAWHGIVIFSEGKAYWNTFRPIVEALLRRNVLFSYYTMDIEDPCLALDEERMDNRYIGSGARAYARIGRLRAGLVLATTPNIGTEGYPIPRSEGIGRLVHVFHDFGDIAGYYRGAFDAYDAILTVGTHQEEPLRKLEALRGLPRKELYPAGLPYMDVLLERARQAPPPNGARAGKTILLAPSWGEKGSLARYGLPMIEGLAREKGWHVILRPHPHSLRVEKERIEELSKVLAPYGNLSWDFEVDGSRSMQQADLMIADSTSGVRVDFLLLYRKPVVTLRIPAGDVSFLEISDLGSFCLEDLLRPFETMVEPEEMERLPAIAKEAMGRDVSGDIERFAKERLFHWGHAGEAVAAYAEAYLRRGKGDR